MESNLRVLFSADALSRSPSGIGRYSLELAKGLQEDPKVGSLTFYRDGKLYSRLEDAQYDSSDVSSRGGIGKFWDSLRFRSKQMTNSIFHAPNYFLPRYARNGIVTVHDLSVFLYPESHPRSRREQFSRRFEHSIRTASAFITDTEVVRQELHDLFGIDLSRIHPIHLGVSSEYIPWVDEFSNYLIFLGLVRGCYGLCVTTLEPRKNVDLLIDAWSELPQQERLRFPLVIAGGQGWLSEEILQRISDCEREGWLRYLGYVTDEALRALYAGARIFVYPSKYEGFGLPVVEAMASGIPVIVSRSAESVKEVVGDVARAVDPEDVRAFSEAILEALSDSEKRLIDIQKGLDLARELSWRRCVNRTINVYSQVHDSI
jgi:glycosyltransferase involved in cell wall biosynthesis